jgi:hypothetical protein
MPFLLTTIINRNRSNSKEKLFDAVVSIESGDDIKTVQSNLGHATASFTLDVYGHVSQKMRQQSADRMEQFIQGLPVPVSI